MVGSPEGVQVTAQDSAPSQGAGKDDLVKALELAKVTLDELFAVAGDTAYPHRNAKKWD